MTEKRWSIFRSTVEVVTIFAASVAAIAAVWQGYLTSKALKQPFQANLQSQEISACSELIYQADDFLGTTTSFLAAVRREPPFVSDGADYEAPLKQSALEKNSAVSSAIRRLKFFAEEKTKKDLESLDSAKTAYLIGAFPTSEKTSWTATSEAPWRAQFQAAVERIALSCDRVLTAVHVGKI